MVKSQVYIRQRLRLYPLRGVYHQDCAVTCRQTPGYLIIKIYMSRRVNQIENIFFSILRPINDADSLRLNRNAPLPLQLHIIKHLCLHFPAGKQSGHFDNPISQCRFSVIYMCNNTKISDFALFYCCHFSSSFKSCIPSHISVPNGHICIA